VARVLLRIFILAQLCSDLQYVLFSCDSCLSVWVPTFLWGAGGDANFFLKQIRFGLLVVLLVFHKK
jgi:hypothetical protein